jgi:hypothetical protein
MSYWGDFISIPGVAAASDLSTKQYHFVKFASTAGQIKVAAATTDAVIGVLQDTPDAAGVAAEVAAVGIALLIAGTSVLTQGTRVGTNTTGRAKTGTARTYGVCLKTVSAIGDEFPVLLDGYNA